MIAYFERECEWMQDGLQLLCCPSFTGATHGILPDLSGKDHNGVLTNTDRNTAYRDGALNFVGTNSFVEINQPQYSYPLTINFWVKITAAHNAYVVLITDGSTTGASFGFVSNQQDLRIGSTQVLAGNLSIGVLSNWTMLTYVLTSQTFRSMYINGTANGTFTASASLPSMNAIRFGGGDFGARRLNGLADDLRVHRRSLTASEIRLLYERDRGGGMLREPPKRRSFFVPTLPFANRRRSSRFLGFPG